MGKPIRVLVVDDSPFLRHTLTSRLAAAGEIAVVGTAADGVDALARVIELKPDVVVLDVEMPRMDGLAALQRIMAECPTPVVMFSALTQRGARATIQALVRGAVDFVPKPAASAGMQGVIAELVAKIKAAASVSLQVASLPRVRAGPAAAKQGARAFRHGDTLIVIGASTGGPRALHWILSELPGNLPAAVAVVQHMPAGFTLSLAQRLNENSALTVEEATPGRHLEQGLALLAPGDLHLRFDSAGRAILDKGPRRNHVRPAVDVTMESAAELGGPTTVGVVLTGMGQDGTAGARCIRQAGGKVIAEDPSTSVLDGMPRSVVEAGLADQIVPLPEIAARLTSLVKHG